MVSLNAQMSIRVPQRREGLTVLVEKEENSSI